jgi:hypothetical protein
MRKPVSGAETAASNDMLTSRAPSSSLFSPPEHEWQPARLPELASNGFPFSPTFILPKPQTMTPQSVSLAEPTVPFGFHYRTPTAVLNRPVIDLTKGSYDPHTQTYTIPLCAGGDTDGGTVDTGHYTEVCGGDGAAPSKEWDTSPDRVTD